VRAAAAISTPFDLSASVRALQVGFSRLYQHLLVKSLKGKTLEKLARHSDIIDPAALRAIRTLMEFDNHVTAPVGGLGFRDADAYWAASSSAAFLPRIRRPTLLINAQDDPFLPAEALPRQAIAQNPFLTAEFPARGGHVGFLAGRWPWVPIAWAERRAAAFLAANLDRRPDAFQKPVE
jgi:predicted alpha/beta-fold hydrolase